MTKIIQSLVLYFIKVLMNYLSSEQNKILIEENVKKLLNHETDGITKDVAYTMLTGIVNSALNEVTPGMVSKALSLLKK